MECASKSEYTLNSTSHSPAIDIQVPRDELNDLKPVAQFG